jgi:hypothetical protein
MTMEDKDIDLLLSQYFKQVDSSLQEAQGDAIVEELIQHKIRYNKLRKSYIWIVAASAIILISFNIIAINHFQQSKPIHKMNPVYSEYLSQFNQM